MFARVAKAHDALTRLSFALSKACLVAIVATYSYETAARYFFNAPWQWSGQIVGYALSVGLFLALPELTRRKGHIAITFVLEALPVAPARGLRFALDLVSGLVCLVVAWIAFEANLRHIANDEMMVEIDPIPKIWLSVWITYGFLSAGLHFLRALGDRGDTSGEQIDEMWS